MLVLNFAISLVNVLFIAIDKRVVRLSLQVRQSSCYVKLNSSNKSACMEESGYMRLIVLYVYKTWTQVAEACGSAERSITARVGVLFVNCL